jgi:riboflavin kinase/FMN adenylyltransferase
MEDEMIHKQGIEQLNHTCVAFGGFDGVHKGHRAVLKKLEEAAREHNLTAVVLSLYYPGEQVLTTEAEKEYHMKEYGPDILISCEATEHLLSGGAEAFVKNILIGQLGASVIITGENCCFGEKKEGGLELLKAAAAEAGVQIITCETITDGGLPISSQRLKAVFLAGDFEGYVRMCGGYPYVIAGKIVHGKALGRTVGMPTANLGVDAGKIMPPNGVYATLSTVDGEVHQGLTNIGKRPSVDDYDLVTIETFLLDFSKDIYGKPLVLEIYFFIRGVVKFNNLSEVQHQVEKDLENTRLKLGTIIKTKQYEAVS